MTFHSIVPLKLPRIIGHRGACGYAPENTLASFAKAHELGATWVEFDVQLTQDEKVVVFHDGNLTRLAGVNAVLADLDYAEASQYDIGSSFSSEFAGQSIPLLEDVLRYLLEVGITPNIEIKPNRHNEWVTAERVVQLVQHLWPADRMPPILSSFSLPILQALRSLDSEVPLGFLCEILPDDWQAITRDLHCSTVHIDHHVVDRPMVEAVHDEGYLMLCYTVNDPDRARYCFDCGVDAIITDFPDRMADGVKSTDAK